MEPSLRDIGAYCVSPDASLGEVVACIDRNQAGIALLVDVERRLVGTITDGDVRRAILAGRDLAVRAATLIELKAQKRPITALVGIDAAELLHRMRTAAVRQIPLVDDQDVVHDLVLLEDLVPDEPLALEALIMAGGYGTRLHPLTEQTPKPMLPVGDRPLMELTIQRLRNAGISRVNISTHFLPEKIKDHFGDGREFGVSVGYVEEDRPLGTAGALALMGASKEPLLVINGDILTEVNFRDMLEFHRESGADLTAGVRKIDVEVPYGVVHCEGDRVMSLTEKPQFSFFVNAGIYLLEPSVQSEVPSGQRFNMTDLIQRLLDANRKVASFPIREYWLDIGRHADYESAQQFMKGNQR